MRKEFLFILLLLLCIKSNAQVSTPRVSIITKDWQEGGIFAGKAPEQEILSARTEFSKKFDRGNGLVDIYFGGPFHYTDNNGILQDINLDIIPHYQSASNYINYHNQFISRFGEIPNSGVQMEYKNKMIAFGLMPKISAGNWNPVPFVTTNTIVKNNTIQYQNVYNNIDIGYEVTTEAIKHQMIFRNKEVFAGIPLTQQYVNVEELIHLPANAILSDNEGVITSNKVINGNLFVSVNGEIIFTIKKSYIWDAAFNGNPDEQSQSPNELDNFKAVQTSIVILSENAVRLIAAVPVSWLQSSSRVFPVVLDPTVNVGNVGSFNSSYRYPFNTCRQQRVSQILFRKSDINAGSINTTGTITDIAFYQNTPVPIANNNVQVKMQEVSWNAMTTPTLTSSGFTNVFGPTTQSFTSTNQWKTLTLTTPFTFSNTNNLLIEARFSNSTSTSGCNCDNTGPGGHWGWYNSPYAGHRWAYSTGAAPPPSGNTCNYNNSPEGNPAYGYFIPATRITINTTGGCVPVSFTTHPSSQTVVAPAQAQFTVAVSGTSPTYQWEISTNGGASWSNVPVGAPYSGITTNQLTINPTSNPLSNNRYRCRVTNSCTPSPVTSNTAVLTINAAGCGTVVTPASSPSIPAAGGTGSFNINVTPNTCSWSASETLTWVTITSPLSGTGDGTLSYTVAANTGGPRSGTITVNGQSHTINQLGAAAPTTYTISGRVIENGSVGIPNAVISTTPAQGTTLTDAQGYYTLNVPLAYTGTVRATLAPYIFTPITHPVSSSNFSNKDFDAMGVSINIQPSSFIYPWQREGDDIVATINVSMGTTTTNWRLKADVYDVNNVLTSVLFPPITALTYTINTALTNPVANQTFKNLCKNGSRVEYIAIYIPNPSITDTIRSTKIIEKKWATQNTVLFNVNGQELKIPMKYVSGATKFEVGIQRVSSRSSYAESLRPTSPQGCLFGLSFCNSYTGSDGYLHIPVGGSNNLDKVPAGEFQYTVGYFNNSNNVVSQEVGYFDLTKIGNLYNSRNSAPNKNKISVMVGGNIDMEVSIDLLLNKFPTTQYSPQDKPLLGWSIARDICLGYGRNTWYIATGNLNPLQKNAYNIGIALEEIRRLCILSGASVPDISVIAHSKGGLEMRMMMDGKGAPNSSIPNFTLSPTNPFSNVSVSNSLKSVIFIGTPHRGVDPGYEESPVAPLSFISNQINATPIRNYFAGGTSVPNNIRIGNVAAYRKCNLGDGSVDLPSSDNFLLNGASYIRKFYVKSIPMQLESGNASEIFSQFCDLGGCAAFAAFIVAPPPFTALALLALPCQAACLGNTFYQAYVSTILSSSTWNRKFHHCYLTSSHVLNDPQITCLADPVSSAYGILGKIISVIDNNPVSNCVSPLTVNCPPSWLQLYKSVLRNATVERKNGNTYEFIGYTDQNGILQIPFDDLLSPGDSLKLHSPGVDTIRIVVDPFILQSGKLKMPFFKSQISSQKIQNPQIKLVNQTSIVSNPTVAIEVSCDNAISYNILTNLDTAFRPLLLTNNIANIPLDSGSNSIMIMFNGPIDTVMLSKEVFYFPNQHLNDFSYNVTFLGNTNTLGARIYSQNYNDPFIKEIQSTNESVALLNQNNSLTIIRHGYKDANISVSSSSTIDLTNVLIPYSYSSLTDSTIFNFNNRPNPQYWKTITVKNLSTFSNVQLIAKQYDDPFAGMSLKPQTRKFAFKRVGSNAVYYKTAIALDQINTPDKDSVYLLSVKGDRYIKYLPNVTGVTEYDPEVQKVEFDKLDFTSNNTHEIVLMQKQRPTMKPMDTIWHSGQTLVFPISMFVQDPDSIKNDITASSADVKVVVNGNLVYVTAPVNFSGTTTFTLTGTHDWLDETRVYTMKVIPPEVFIPTAFTPNNDGLNDILRPTFMGKLLYCHFSIYNRGGQKVFDTKDCLAGWNGKIQGVGQGTGSFVYYLTYRFEGVIEKEKSVKGVFTLIR
ncbi:MAG: hypothetical protein HOP10_02025 [Chitinophagaceae bacterium]|nr:hypothetical protein [Chitinophagaceae bacterium]